MRAKARARLPAALRPKVGESDVVQDAYLAAFLALADFEDRGDGSFLRWIRGILDHKIADELRRHIDVGKRDARREVRLPRSTAGGGIAAQGQRSPSAEVVADEQAATLRAVIDSLPDEHATILRHVHLDGVTIAEAGTRMGKSASAARKLYGRALSRLTERLRGHAGSTAS